MKICSKCKIEQPETNYYTYWHSTQKKYRTRNICNPCMYKQKKEYKSKIRQEKTQQIEILVQEEIIQPVQPELEINLFQDNTDYKLCKGCNEYKDKVSGFYYIKQTGYYHQLCKVCHNNKSKEATRRYYEEKRKNNGGSETISPKPNTYRDEYQKEQTFWIMELMGWTYNDNGVWSKEGIKDKDKNWVKIPKKEKGIKKPRPVFDVQEMLRLRNEGYLFREIGERLGCSKPTVIKYLKKYENAQN